MAYLAWGADGLTRTELACCLALGGVFQGTGMVTAQVIVQDIAGPERLGAAAASAQLSRSLGSAFGTALASALLFGLLSAESPEGAALFGDIIRHGTVVVANMPADQTARLCAAIAHAFSGVFLLVAAISSLSAAMAATMPEQRL